MERQRQGSSHTTLILLPYSFSSSFIVGFTRLQNGHWNSE